MSTVRGLGCSGLSQPFWLYSWGLWPAAFGRVEGELYLVTEDLDLAHSPVHQLAAATATVVGVDLQVQGHPLHPLLGGEVCAQAVHPNEHLQTGTAWCWKPPQAAAEAPPALPGQQLGSP